MEMKENPRTYLLNFLPSSWYFSVGRISFGADDGVDKTEGSVSQSNQDRSDHLYSCQIWTQPSEQVNVVLKNRVYILGQSSRTGVLTLFQLASCL